MNRTFLETWNLLSAMRGELDLALDALARFNADPTPAGLATLRLRAVSLVGFQDMKPDPSEALATFIREVEAKPR